MSEPIIYEMRAVGHNRVLDAFHSIESSFKGIARDIDVVGGEMSSKFAKAAADAVSVATAIGTGGLAGGAAALSAAVGIAADAWKRYEEAVAKAASASAEHMKKEREEAEKLVELTLKRRKGLTDEQTTRNDLALAIRRQQVETLRLEVFQAEAHIKELQRLGKASEIRDEMVRRDIMKAELAIQRTQLAVDTTVNDEAKKLNAKKEANAAEAASSQETADKITAAQKAAAEKQKAEMYRQANDEARFEREREARRERDADLNAAAQMAADVRAQKADEEANAEADRIARKEADETRLHEQRREQIADEQTSLANYKSAVKAAAEAERELARERENQVRAARLEQAANDSFAVAMTAVRPIVQSFTSDLAVLGEVNRENYRDFLIEADELPALMARKAQVIAAQIAQQAAGQAAFETAEAIKETAIGIGFAATPGMQGFAAGHFASAATHAASAAAYAALGGAAGGAALAIGASRGEGGLFALTQEEREAQDRKRGGGAGASGGFSSSGSTGRGDGVGNTTVNFYYGAGSISTQDERAAAKTVTRGIRNANRDAFLRAA